MSDSSQPHELQPTRLLWPWDFPGKSTGVGCHRLLQYALESMSNQPLFSCCCCSVVQSCLTLCDPMDCSTPGFPVLHHLPEFAQLMSIELVMPPNLSVIHSTHHPPNSVIPFSSCLQSLNQEDCQEVKTQVCGSRKSRSE